MERADPLKDTKKSKNKMKVLVIVLAVVCLVQGSIIYYIVRPEPDLRGNIEDFSNFIHKSFKQNNKKNWDSFDRFFDDDFFKKHSDPFDTMERFHKRLEEMMEGKLRDPFNRSWESWFENRFSDNAGEIEIETEETREAYVITLNTQNLKDNVLNIDIDKDGILINGDYTKIIEKKDSDGTILSRQERRRSITRKFPIPKDANYQKANIKHKTTEVIITLPKNL